MFQIPSWRLQSLPQGQELASPPPVLPELGAYKGILPLLTNSNVPFLPLATWGLPAMPSVSSFPSQDQSLPPVKSIGGSTYYPTPPQTPPGVPTPPPGQWSVLVADVLPPSPQAPVELNPFDLGTQLEGPGMLPCPALTWTGNQVLWAEIKHREENQARVEDGVVGLLGPEDHYLGGLSTLSSRWWWRTSQRSLTCRRPGWRVFVSCSCGRQRRWGA